ncbi:MAG: AAA family ATPase [Magnetococcales bacterium]|nr:AAA family ATPase [Magnetococcales bacterium]
MRGGLVMLNRLYVKNFKNFRDAELIFGPVTVLLGTNASGKSNIRDAMRFLHGVGRGYSLVEILGEKWGQGGYLEWRGIRGGIREACLGGEDYFHLTVFFQYLYYNIAVYIGHKRNLGSPMIIRENISIRNDANQFISIFNTINGIDKDDSLGFNWQNQIQAQVLFYNSEHEIEKKQINFPRNRPLLSQIPELIGVPIEVQQICNSVLHDLRSIRFLDFDPEALRRPSIPGQLILGDKGENLSSVLQHLCSQPDTREALLAWIRELIPMEVTDFLFTGNQEGKIQLTLVEAGGRQISAYSASDGTLRFLGVLASLMGPDMAKVHFFEELDNGIHPTRLHLLLDMIERLAVLHDKQVVMTTHSPQLLHLLSPESLKHASLVYRHPEIQEGKIIPVLDIPDIRTALEQQDLARLMAGGWMEDALHFADNNLESPTVENDLE